MAEPVRRRVVFNADDFGMSLAKNAGVIAAARTGIVREASLCVTGPALAEARAEVTASGVALGIGLHFSLTFGRALTGVLPGLTDPRGDFLPLPHVLVACLRRSIERDAVERELRAQLARLTALGFDATHLNGHHHVHVFPIVRDAVLAVLAEEPSLFVRLPFESPRTAWPISAHWALLAALSAGFVRRAKRELGAERWLPVVGLELGRRRDHARAFRRLAARLPEGAVEWVVHPGDGGADGGGGFGRSAAGDELSTLTAPSTRELIARFGITPSDYREVAESLGRDSGSKLGSGPRS